MGRDFLPEEEVIRIKPDVMQTMLLFKIYKSLKKSEKTGALATFKGPMTRMFKRELQYQFRRLLPGQSGRVWYMMNPQPERLVGIITEVGNDWYPNTSLEWFIDYDPKFIQYQIAPTNNPKEFNRGIPFHYEVEWVAYNDGATPRTFGVLTDGFFISKGLFNKMVSEQNG